MLTIVASDTLKWAPTKCFFYNVLWHLFIATEHWLGQEQCGIQYVYLKFNKRKEFLKYLDNKCMVSIHNL